MNVCFISAYFENLGFCEEKKSLKNIFLWDLCWLIHQGDGKAIKYHARVKIGFWHLDLLLQKQYCGVFFWSVPSIATVTRQVRKSQFRSWMNSKQRCLCFWYSTMETKFVIFVDQEKNVWPPSCQDPRHARVPSECPPLSLWPGNTTTYTQKYICMYI